MTSKRKGIVIAKYLPTTQRSIALTRQREAAIEEMGFFLDTGSSGVGWME
jgi:hypothetical protein